MPHLLDNGYPCTSTNRPHWATSALRVAISASRAAMIHGCARSRHSRARGRGGLIGPVLALVGVTIIKRARARRKGNVFGGRLSVRGRAAGRCRVEEHTYFSRSNARCQKKCQPARFVSHTLKAHHPNKQNAKLLEKKKKNPVESCTRDASWSMATRGTKWPKTLPLI